MEADLLSRASGEGDSLCCSKDGNRGCGDDATGGIIVEVLELGQANKSLDLAGGDAPSFESLPLGQWA